MTDPRQIEQALARNLREWRGKRGWSQAELATRAGLSKGMLVQIEQARTNPSIATLCRVADAFGVALAELVELASSSLVRVVAPDEVVRLWTGIAGSGGDLLVGTDRGEHVEMWRWHLAPGDRHESDGHLDGTRELIAVISGTLTLSLGEESHQVAAGGAVLFDAHGPHRYVNDHKRPLDLVLVVVQPPVLDPGTASHPG